MLSADRSGAAQNGLAISPQATLTRSEPWAESEQHRDGRPGKQMTTLRSLEGSNLTINDGLLCLAGYGLRVEVERGRLEVADGICGERHRASLTRATSRLKRLVILGHT